MKRVYLELIGWLW